LIGQPIPLHVYNGHKQFGEMVAPESMYTLRQTISP